MTMHTTPAHTFGTNTNIEVVRNRDLSDPEQPFDVVTISINGHEFDLNNKDAAQLAASVVHAIVL